ncbi:MAG: TolC family protein [Myxococcota bacterium]
MNSTVGLLLIAAELMSSASVLTLSEVRARALAQAGSDQGPNYARTRLAEIRASRRPMVAASVDLSAAPGGELFTVESVEGERVVVSAINDAREGPEAFAPQLRYGAIMGLDWKAHDFGRTAASIRAAEAELRAARLESALERANLVEAVDIAYLGWLQAYAQRELQQRVLSRVEDRVAVLSLEEAAGSASLSEVAEAEIRGLAAELQSLDAEDALADARQQLEGAAGFDLPPRSVPDLAWLAAPAVEAKGGPSRADILAARLSAAEAQLLAAGRAKRARLGVEASAGLRGQFATPIPVYQGGVELRVPITDGGVAQARVEQARAEADGLRLRLQDAQSAEARSARHADAGRARAEARVELSTRYLELATDALDGARTEAGSPEGDARVQRAWAQVEQAQSTLLSARVGRAERLLAQSRNGALSPSPPPPAPN